MCQCAETFLFFTTWGVLLASGKEASHVPAQLKFDLTAHNTPLAQMPLALAEKECGGRDKQDPAGLTPSEEHLGVAPEGRLSSGQSLFP